MKMPRFYFPRPTLDFYLDLGVLRIHTGLWNTQMNMDAFMYVMVFVEVWRKEIFRFRLYETGMQRRVRQTQN